MVRTVQKSYRKNILREMKSSISRVVSLFGIVALGVMMLTGLMCIAPDMRTAAQKYYVQQNVFDLRVLSTLGLSQSDINAIAAVDGVDAVQAVKYQDVEGHWTGDEQTTVARLYQLPADPQADTPENMNRLVLLSGRMPEAAGECVVHVMGHGSPVELGTQLILPEETEGVSGQVFTVVGTVQDPLHFSSDSESSTVGDGQLDCILFVPEGTLIADYYTMCYIKAENAGLYDNYSDEYQAAVDAVAEKLKAIQSVQCTARREELMDTANDKLTEARAEYDSQKAEAERQFAEAEEKLADAQQQLDAAKVQLEAGEKELAAQKAALPDTMQSGADKLVSSEAQVLEFEEQLQQIELLVNLKKVADPLLTYAEAALRNAEKALGYSNLSIAGKYLFYALLATILGSIVGMVVGFVVFPIIIWNAYQLVFTLPTFTLHFYPGMAAASVGISAAVIGFATWYACRSSLAEKTAALLLPRAPVAGKRILMERITPLWQRMSFSQKTTARNLFRYKKRFFMTVLGVAGCTALLLIGFGIQDSLLPIVTKQSTELTHNDMSITLSDPKALTMEQGLAEELDGNSAVQNWGAVYTKSTTIYNAEGESASVSIVAAAKDSDLTRYVTFRTRKGHKAISFDSGSVILTEKTAENLGLHTGDTFWVENAEGTRVELTLTGITENYMFTRLYLPRAQLESLLGTAEIPWNTVYGQTTCTDTAGYNALRTDLLDCNYVSSISFTEDTTELFDNLIVSLGYVVVLIIICAAALAAVVLYNLISVNLGERKKELATIKVLGFYDQEVYRYIFREIELLALIGSGVGLALGVPLHKFIILTVEMDQLMFIRTIAPRSYLLAVALTMVFTVVVCFAMRRHVRRISMVESMKAPE